MQKIRRCIVLISIVFTSISCNSKLYVQEEMVIYNNFEIPLYETSLKDIEENLGSNHQRFNWNEYSTEYIYHNKGISFSHKQEDSLKMIYWINLKTNRNIINIENRIKIDNRTRVSDVIEIFGINSWAYDNTYNGLILEYEYFDIIIALTENEIQLLNEHSIPDDEKKLYDFFKDSFIKGVEIY